MCYIPQPTQRYLTHPIPAVAPRTVSHPSFRWRFFSLLQWETWCALCDKALGAEFRWFGSKIGFWSSREVANWGVKVGPIAPKIALPQKNCSANWRILTKYGICRSKSRLAESHLHEMSHEIESGTERGLVQALGLPDFKNMKMFWNIWLFWKIWWFVHDYWLVYWLVYDNGIRWQHDDDENMRKYKDGDSDMITENNANMMMENARMKG